MTANKTPTIAVNIEYRVAMEKAWSFHGMCLSLSMANILIVSSYLNNMNSHCLFVFLAGAVWIALEVLDEAVPRNTAWDDPGCSIGTTVASFC
jgi:hypothetical protein